MSSNKVRKSVSLNKTNPDDYKIIKKIEPDDFNFNEWVRKLMIEEIRREERMAVQKGQKGGLKIIVGK